MHLLSANRASSARYKPSVLCFIFERTGAVMSKITDSTNPGYLTRGTSLLSGGLLPLSAAVLLSSLGTSIANVALPNFATAFGAPFHAVQWVSIAYLLTMTALVVAAGRLGDMYGRRKLLLVGLGIFTAASVPASLAPGLEVLVAARASQGVGAALMMSLGMALVSESVPAEKTGSAMGLLGTMSAVGTALGPTLGGLMIDLWGWPSIFLVNVPAGVIVLVMVQMNVPKQTVIRAPQLGLDMPGLLTLAATLATYALSMTIGRGHFGMSSLAMLVLVVIGIATFVLIERQAKTPLVPLKLLNGRAMSVGLFTNMVVSAVLMSTLVVGPFYLSIALGLKAAMVGVVMSVGPLLSALTGVPAGRLVDRIGAPQVSILGLFGILLGCGLLVVLPETLGVAGYVGPIAMITVSYALFQAANNTAIMKDVAQQDRGVTSGLLNLSRNLGLVTGTSVMGAIFALGVGSPNLAAAGSEAVVSGMHLAFTVSAAFVVLALLAAGLNLSLAARNTGPEGEA